MSICLEKGNKNAIRIQVFERRPKSKEDYTFFNWKIRKYVYKFNIFFHPVMIVPVEKINSKERIGQFIQDHYGEGEFYVMSRMTNRNKRKIGKWKPPRKWGKIAFVKVMEYGDRETSYVQLKYPMHLYWFWQK